MENLMEYSLEMSWKLWAEGTLNYDPTTAYNTMMSFAASSEWLKVWITVAEF